MLTYLFTRQNTTCRICKKHQKTTGLDLEFSKGSSPSNFHFFSSKFNIIKIKFWSPQGAPMDPP